MRWLLPALLTLAMAACGTAPKKSSPPPASSGSSGGSVTSPRDTAHAKDCSFYAPMQEDRSKRGNYTAGGLYAPGVADTTPDHVPDLDCILEPVVTAEPRSPVGNRSPYSVLGKQYRVLDDPSGYRETGTASYYGNKFHGRLTSNREVYDMYAYSAAHKTLPLPSFARVTNLDNGESVIVRVNDRGPFHEGRVIDLSYAAAIKLGITQRGTGRVEVRALTADDKPSRDTRVASAPAARPAASEMDTLVRKLPAETVAAAKPIAVSPPATTPASAHRYHVVSNPGEPVSADRFDAWMRENGVTIATGKPTPIQPDTSTAGRVRDAASRRSTSRNRATPSAATTQTATAAVAASPSTTAHRDAVDATTTVASLSPAPALDNALQLQVGSFASRQNADRALARLHAAGIVEARLSDVQSNGRVLWRLRVGAPDQAHADELAGRIAGLGFERPRIVRE